MMKILKNPKYLIYLGLMLLLIITSLFNRGIYETLIMLVALFCFAIVFIGTSKAFDGLYSIIKYKENSLVLKDYIIIILSISILVANLIVFPDAKELVFIGVGIPLIIRVFIR